LKKLGSPFPAKAVPTQSKEKKEKRLTREVSKVEPPAEKGEKEGECGQENQADNRKA